MAEQSKVANQSQYPPGEAQGDWADKKAREILLASAMQATNNIRVDSVDVCEYYKGLLTESDRASGILAFAFIESQITEIFVQYLDKGIPGGVEAIVGRNGILNTVGARLKILRALRWIRQDTYSDLRLLASVRNRFAHSHLALTFADPKISGYLSAIRKHEKRVANDYYIEQFSTKQLFLARTLLTLFETYCDLVLMPASFSAGIGPTGAFSAEYDLYPVQLRQALAACTKAIYLVCKEWRKEGRFSEDAHG